MKPFTCMHCGAYSGKGNQHHCGLETKIQTLEIRITAQEIMRDSIVDSITHASFWQRVKWVFTGGEIT